MTSGAAVLGLAVLLLFVALASSGCKGGAAPDDGAASADLRAPQDDLQCTRVSTTCEIPDPPRCPLCACGYKISPCKTPGQRCTYHHDATSPGPYTFVVECAPDGSLTCISGPCWGEWEDLGPGKDLTTRD